MAYFLQAFSTSDIIIIGYAFRPPTMVLLHDLRSAAITLRLFTDLSLSSSVLKSFSMKDHQVIDFILALNQIDKGFHTILS